MMKENKGMCCSQVPSVTWCGVTPKRLTLGPCHHEELAGCLVHPSPRSSPRPTTSGSSVEPTSWWMKVSGRGGYGGLSASHVRIKVSGSGACVVVCLCLMSKGIRCTFVCCSLNIHNFWHIWRQQLWVILAVLIGIYITVQSCAYFTFCLALRCFLV